MKKAFIAYGTAICLIFAYASYTGWTVTDGLKSTKWAPAGNNVYHK